ncbi:MAG: cytochrome c-type biosis protein CcmH [Thermoleophilaceae bacterium]|nr:cytochrome c-type biosis protein CcmH [Thermoleophilaceae bacterium]
MRLLAALLALALALPAGAAAATCPKTSLGDVSDEVMCLQCGVPLNVSSEAPAAKRERVFIQRQVDACRSKQQIKDALVAQFGTAILAEPQKKSAWLVPAIGFALGAVAIAFAAWRWRSKRGAGGGPTTAAAAGAPLSGADAARLDADIERYDL